MLLQPKNACRHCQTPRVKTTHLHEWCFTPFLASSWAERFTEHISQHNPPTFLPLYLTQLQTLTFLGWWGGGKVTGSEEIQKRSPLIFLAQWGQETVCFTCCHSLTPNSTEIMIDTLYLLNKYVNKWGNKWNRWKNGMMLISLIGEFYRPLQTWQPWINLSSTPLQILQQLYLLLLPGGL